MNIVIIFIIILLLLCLKNSSKNSSLEGYSRLTKYPETNLAALSRTELQSASTLDLSKIDWTKVDDYTYSKIVCLIQGCDEKAIIKNLPVFSST